MSTGVPQNETARGATVTATGLVCPSCGKALEGEPNFCPACGADLRGLGGDSDTLSGPLKDKLIDGRYKLLEKLGEGGMGAVFKVEHARMGKIAALKLMRPDAAVDKILKGRFLQEARVVAKLSHPNTVGVFDSGELEDGSLYIAMEFVPGKDLAWHLKAHGPMSEEKAVSIGVQVLASLQEAHEYGIVHRDIKPANIMLVRRRKSGDDQVKLLDFGIAKLAEAEGRKSTTGDFIGTPAYMSPEQIRGEGVDARSDLYSLGAVLFELVTSKQLYDGPTPISIVTQHTDSPIPRVQDRRLDAHVSPQFEGILRKALAKKPDERYQDAEAMRAALEALRRDLGALPNEYTPMPSELADKMLSRQDFDKYERSLRVQRTVTPVFALAAIVAVGVGVWRYSAIRHAAESTLKTHEVEPNDHPGAATTIPLETEVRGTIGARANAEADRDLFLAQLPTAGPVRVTLSGVPDLNLTLEVLQLERQSDGDDDDATRRDKLKRRAFLDDVGLGDTERIDGLQLAAGGVYLRVEEKPWCTEPNRPPREKSLTPYTLRIDPLPADGPVEHEPNDTESTAQALPMTKALLAWTGTRLDDLERLTAMRPDAPFSTADWFRIESAPEELVYLAVVPPERGALLVLDNGAERKAGPLKARVVRGSPQLIELRATQGPHRVRVVAGEDVLPGSTYRLAVATNAENGLAGLLDLARLLGQTSQPAARRALLEQAAKALEGSPQADQLAQLLTQ